VVMGSPAVTVVQVETEILGEIVEAVLVLVVQQVPRVILATLPLTEFLGRSAFISHRRAKMIAIKRQFLIFALPLLVSGCSSMNTRNTILRDMAIGAAVGALVAQTKTENRDAYAAMYAGVGAASAGVLSAVVNISEDENVKKENELLKSQIKKFEKQLQPQLVQQGNSLFASPIPKEVSALVEPGEWKRYKMDQWVQDPNQSNTWYRQIEMFEIIPPVAK